MHPKSVQSNLGLTMTWRSRSQDLAVPRVEAWDIPRCRAFSAVKAVNDRSSCTAYLLL